MCTTSVQVCSKKWQVSWFVLGTITLNGTDTTVKRLDRNVKTFSATVRQYSQAATTVPFKVMFPKQTSRPPNLFLETATRGYWKFCDDRRISFSDIAKRLPPLIRAKLGKMRKNVVSESYNDVMSFLWSFYIVKKLTWHCNESVKCFNGVMFEEIYK